MMAKFATRRAHGTCRTWSRAIKPSTSTIRPSLITASASQREERWSRIAVEERQG